MFELLFLLLFSQMVVHGDWCGVGPDRINSFSMIQLASDVDSLDPGSFAYSIFAQEIV